MVLQGSAYRRGPDGPGARCTASNGGAGAQMNTERKEGPVVPRKVTRTGEGTAVALKNRVPSPYSFAMVVVPWAEKTPAWKRYQNQAGRGGGYVIRCRATS